MHPQIVLVAGKDIEQQKLLPLLCGTPGAVVQIYRTLTQRLVIRQQSAFAAPAVPVGWAALFSVSCCAGDLLFSLLFDVFVVYNNREMRLRYMVGARHLYFFAIKR